ncbi:hypothetical protein VTK73DRAFT_10221 [Phialemonium thermophilum]|uniref:Carboxymethylenebutenolidase n=1 Tax=Phialemonium thermophilum TaxID=223376 RepID=A0ABR3VXT3_9PEZI
MYNDISKPPPPLPSIQFQELGPGIALLLPLSRRGQGPGLIILVPGGEEQLTIADGVPSPLIKWAEEGYAVVEIQQRALEAVDAALKKAVESLSRCGKCDSDKYGGKIGLVSYDPSLWNQVAPALKESAPSIVAAVSYGNADQEGNLAACPVPVLYQLAGKASTPGPDRRIHPDDKVVCYYPGMSSFKFATPFQPSFHYPTEALSHTRSLQHLKSRMGGPYFDLETIWDEHTYYEFADRSVEHTMSTMVQEPYVNHVTTLTGGVGRSALSEFYRDNFIFLNSLDTELELVSRSIGIDRVIDEFIFKFTHDRMIDWLLPGVPPTGLKAEIPFTAVVNIRGDRLYHEHIAWDQGTLLRQLGLLPEYLPFVYPQTSSSSSSSSSGGQRVEYRVPVAGIDTAKKLRDRSSVPSNDMFRFKTRTV